MGGVPLEVDTRKAIALLAYLAVEGNSPRDTLAALFWRDSNTDRARATLRRTLSSLRSAVGTEVVNADRLQITMQGANTDVAQFAAALEATTRHDHSSVDVCPQCLPHLRMATGLYRGDFLDGFAIRDAPEFEEWVRNTAEYFRLQAGEAFNRLSNVLAAAGDYAGAIVAARRWVDLNPLHEPAHRQLMLLHAWSGDRPGAVEAYRRCTAILDEELDVTPLEETTELYEAILDEDLPPPPGARRRVVVADNPLRTMVPGELIDRVGQLRVLEEEFELSRSKGRVVIVTGEPWMGKTRLLQEFVVRSGVHGASARGFRAERTLPFGVVAQLLRNLPSLPDDTPAWARREVSRLVPELTPQGQDPDPLPVNFGETRLFDALVGVLGTWIASLWLISVDDVQWCDQASASFLSYLANRIDTAPRLLVLSMRSGDPDAPQSLVDLTRPGRGTRLIELGPMQAADLVSLVADPSEAARVVEQTGGIPLLISQFLAEGEGDITLGVRRFVESHLADLNGLERQLLAAAAVLDGVCDLPLLRLTSGRSENEVVDAVESLVSRDLLRMSPDGGTVTFSLESVGHFVYEATTVVRRRLLHDRAGAALRDRAQTAPDARLVTAVARHLQMSGNEAEAAEWYMRAGDLAFQVYAHVETEASYRLAQALGHPDRARIRLSLAEMYLLTARYREALAEFEAVAATSSGEELALAEHGIGEVHRRLGRLEAAHHHFQAAVADHPQPARLYADWALLAQRSGQPDAARRMAERSLAEAHASSDPSLRARAHHLLGVVSTSTIEARDHYQQALDLAADDPIQRMASLNGLAHTVSHDGDFAEAVVLVEQAAELAHRIGDRHREAALFNHLADLHHRDGNRQRAEELVTESVRLFASIEPDAWEPEIWLLTGW